MKLKKLIKKSNKQHKIFAVIIILAITSFGVKLLFIGHAQTPYASVNASGGNITGGASVVDDATASNGKAVMFQSITPSNNPTGVPAGISPGNAFMVAFINMTTAQQTSTIALMKADGVKWLRIDVSGSFSYKAFIQAANLGGINVMATLQNWGTETNPTSPSAYASYATSAVQTLKPLGVEDYEILNEPNGCEDKMSPSTYVGILKAAYTSIKAADPSAFVISAGLCPHSTDGSASGYEPLDYLKAMYSAGAQGYFDAFGDHPYSGSETAHGTSSYNPWTYLPTIHNLMASNGDGNKKIWLTEYGCPTVLDINHSTLCSPQNGVNLGQEDAQAARITDAFAVARGAPQQSGQTGWTFIGGPLFIFNWEDSCDGYYGLYTVTSGAVCDSTTRTYPTTTDITPVAKSAPLSAFSTAAKN